MGNLSRGATELRSSPNLFGETVQAAKGEVIVDRPAFVSFVEAVEDSEEDRSESNAGDFDDSLRQTERLQVAVDFGATAKLAKLLPLVEHLDAVEFTAPFVVERAVVATTMRHPKA